MSPCYQNSSFQSYPKHGRGEKKKKLPRMKAMYENISKHPLKSEIDFPPVQTASLVPGRSLYSGRILHARG